MADGVDPKTALEQAGWSKLQASRGWENVPKKVLAILPKRAKRLMRLGEIDPASQEKISRGRLVDNAIKGQDKGVQSAYRLGQDKRVAMFTPDLMTGVIVLNVPNGPALEDKPVDLDEPETLESR